MQLFKKKKYPNLQKNYIIRRELKICKKQWNVKLNER